jgi:hypothetical protein
LVNISQWISFCSIFIFFCGVWRTIVFLFVFLCFCFFWPLYYLSGMLQ